MALDKYPYKWLNQYKWYALKAHNRYYAVRWENNTKPGHLLRMHRQILGLKKGDGKETDHRNGNGLDDRAANLRVCTHAENQYNRRQIITRARYPKGTRECYSCGRRFTLNKNTLIRVL